ncbi:MAG TPA: S41 family peptidase [Candidatus Sulfomarinibacteraceae bacterium]|nr:S41 family peptidase [Candidatus Sulfomarinibacteraceae bacterium]
MERRSLAVVLFMFYSLILFGGGLWLGHSGWPLNQLGLVSSRMPPEATESFDPFWETWNLVSERFYEQPIDPEMLTEGAIDGMLATLEDPHTRYLPPALEESARQSMEGELQGIGVLVEMVEGRITIVSPFDGSPAEEVGLLPGDVLLEANGQDLSELDLTEAAELIRGPAGTTVDLVVERNGETFEVEVTRAVVEIPSVRAEMLEENLIYLRINRFGNRTEEELEDTLEPLLAQNPRGLILDLRNNPGGGLDAAVDVADHFLDEGIILRERFGTGQERVFESTSGGLAQNIPIAVLINQGSASASEVLAGAIRDRGRGVLVGTQTFGKGTVQTWHALSNGGGVRITTARWLTPDDNWVGVGTGEGGLTPDIVVELPTETPDPDRAPEDTQLQAAIDHLLQSASAAQQ